MCGLYSSATVLEANLALAFAGQQGLVKETRCGKISFITTIKA
jgi:hypothetical protein